MRYQTRHPIPRLLFLTGLLIATVVIFRYFGLGGKFIALEIEKKLQLSFGLAAGVLISLASFICYYEYRGIGPQEGIIRRGPKDKKVVSLTFDDGPSPRYTPAILDILKDKGVKATFFVTGKQVLKHSQIARRIVQEGHDIGNHTYAHRELSPSTRRIVLSQVRKAERAIKTVTGANPHLFRPPRGIYSNAVRKLLLEEGYQIILWTVSTVDWRGVSAKTIVRRVNRYARNGSIILFHDNSSLFRRNRAKRKNTVEALPLVINNLRERGLEIIPVSEMLAMDESLKTEGEG